MREIPRNQVLSRISFENPWWSPPGELPKSYSQLNPRPYLGLVHPLISNRSVRRAVVLMGPRRVGKTVLIHHSIGELLRSGTEPARIAYFSVDHPLYNGLSLQQLLDLYSEITSTNLRNERVYAFFDEIQYLRDWEIHLKSLVDDYPELSLTASGSAAAALRLKSTESGAGRFTDFLLPPLTFYEYLELQGLGSIVAPGEENLFHANDIEELNREFVDYLNFGGYPEVVLSPEIRKDPGRFIKADIVDKVLLRDLPSLYGIQDIQELNYLFTTLAFNTANEVSLEQLSRNSGVAKNTIKRYIEYLEAAFLIRVVHRVDRNARRFKRANFFKVYLTNPSIRCALFAPIGPDDAAIGALVETAVFSQWFHTSDVPLHYARWKDGEVDIVSVAADQSALWAVEAKWSDRMIGHHSELQSAIRFCEANNLENFLATTRSESAVRAVSDSVVCRFKPASEYCYSVGRNLIHGKLGRQRTEDHDKPIQLDLDVG